ncbi:MAG: hydroxyacylglutathione hydrolase [Candidatus Thiodiazotropha sp.]|jgi:hydroxyacylglutathione hydrolase
MKITPLRAFDDNYIWMLRNSGSPLAVAVDPGDETPVLTWLKQERAILSAILITHHHYDHVGGIPELCEAYPGIPVFGPAKESIRGVTNPLQEGDTPVIPGLDTVFQVLDVPGHTAGHIAYLGDGALFCGDTLFAAGCGRVFDGTLDQLSGSLQRITHLPTETQIYCAHEYTLDNLGFARWVEPDSLLLEQRIEREGCKRKSGLPTVPSRLDIELQTNPFLRTQTPCVIAAAEKVAGHSLNSPDEVFRVLRSWKDNKYD